VLAKVFITHGTITLFVCNNKNNNASKLQQNASGTNVEVIKVGEVGDEVKWVPQLVFDEACNAQH